MLVIKSNGKLSKKYLCYGRGVRCSVASSGSKNLKGLLRAMFTANEKCQSIPQDQAVTFNVKFNVRFIAFVNLVFLWHKGRNFLAVTSDCQLAALINFIKGISAAGNWTPTDSFSCRCHARGIRRTRIHNQ